MPIVSSLGNIRSHHSKCNLKCCTPVELFHANTHLLIKPSSQTSTHDIYVFLEQTSFYLTKQLKFATGNLLLVGGGGGGGIGGVENNLYQGFGGGGAGEVVLFPSYLLYPNEYYTAVVGQGGEPGMNGTSSMMQVYSNIPATRVATGGGAGAGTTTGFENGKDGGSGGGAMFNLIQLSKEGQAKTTYIATKTSFANAGGKRESTVEPKGGGGGGAGHAGESTLSGKGGDGILWDIDMQYYGGGGGGGQFAPSAETTMDILPSIAGGLGGGGNGAGDDLPPGNGTENTGGGGGGGNRRYGFSGKGGSGVVKLAFERYWDSSSCSSSSSCCESESESSSSTSSL